MLTIIIIVAVLLGALLLYAATKPGSCQFSRSIHISAPPERIFPLIDDHRAMNEWNPFVKADPDIKLSYSGPANGVGAANDFDGNGKVGSGRAEIVESVHPSKIVMALRMVRPMKCQNRIEFRIAPRFGWRRCHLGDDRPAAVHWQADERFHQYRKNGRGRIRVRPRRIENQSRSLIAKRERANDGDAKSSNLSLVRH